MYNYEIWQLKDMDENRELLFAPYKMLKGKHPDKENYQCVYEGKALSWDEIPHLEDIFSRFQNDGEAPDGFTGRSLSVSDIIVVSINNNAEAVFYCDSTDFRLTAWESKKPVKYTGEILAGEAYAAAVARGLIEDWLEIEEYFLTDRESVVVSKCSFDPFLIPSYGGNEGIYVDCGLKGVFDDSGEKKSLHIATFKTLDVSLDAMIAAGRLAGVMTAMFFDVIDAHWDCFD